MRTISSAGSDLAAQHSKLGSVIMWQHTSSKQYRTGAKAKGLRPHGLLVWRQESLLQACRRGFCERSISPSSASNTIVLQ